MQVVVFVYDPQTGAIISRRTMPEEDVAVQPTPHLVVPAPDNPDSLGDDSTHWVNQGALMERPLMALTVHKQAIAADGVDAARITGMPTGTIMTTSNEPPVQIDDEELLWASELVGVFTLTFSLFPYRPAEIQVTAT
jgi:hypothetical protein